MLAWCLEACLYSTFILVCVWITDCAFLLPYIYPNISSLLFIFDAPRHTVFIDLLNALKHITAHWLLIKTVVFCWQGLAALSLCKTSWLLDSSLDSTGFDCFLNPLTLLAERVVVLNVVERFQTNVITVVEYIHFFIYNGTVPYLFLVYKSAHSCWIISVLPLA